MHELRRRLGVGWQLLTTTLDEYSKDRGDLLAAALAFHTMLSLAPLIIVAVALAGVVLGRGAAHAEVTRVMTDALGAKGAAAVDSWVNQASSNGGVASVVGIGLMLLAASRLGTQLRDALNQIWDIDVKLAQGFRSTIKDYVERRVFAFALVAAAAPLLLLVFASRAVLTHFHSALFSAVPWQGLVVQILQIIAAVSLVAGITTVIFRYVPDTRVGWKNALIGGVLTSVLFNAGNVGVGLYLSRAAVTAAYGAAGSVVVVLLWLYFSAHMLLVGAEFTQVYSQRFGRGLSPAEDRELRGIDRDRGNVLHA